MVWADSPRFLGNGCASLVNMGGWQTPQRVTGCGPRLTTLGSQATRGCLSILRTGFLSGFSLVSLRKWCPLGLCLRSNQGLADPCVCSGCQRRCWKLFVQGLQRIKLPRRFLGKNSFRCSEPRLTCLLSRLRRLNKTVLYHQEKLRENEDALSTKQSEQAQLQVEFRELTDMGFTPTPSPIPTPPQSDHGGEEGEACGEEGVPDVPYGTHFL